MKQVRRAIAGAALTGLFLAGSDAAGQARFDILIRGARILDGTGNPWVRGDIGIVKDRITAVGRLSDATAARVIEAADRYVTPGFIDVHSQAGPGLEAQALGASLRLVARGMTRGVGI